MFTQVKFCEAIVSFPPFFQQQLADVYNNYFNFVVTKYLRANAKLVDDDKVRRIHKEKARCQEKLAKKKEMKKQKAKNKKFSIHNMY